MRTLTPNELLQVWESGLERNPAERALAMLRVVHGPASGDDLARLPIGDRDARLLSLRERAFGSEIHAVALCGKCGESIETKFNVDGLRVSASNATSRCNLDVHEFSVEFRLPDSLDLLALQDAPPEQAGLRGMLLGRCVYSATRLHEPVAAADLPDWVIDAIAQVMAAADPQAEIELALECTACNRQWYEPFDIESFLWHEIQAWSARTLYEVHQLAAAYGWNEAEILALSPVRRSAYLNLIVEY